MLTVMAVPKVDPELFVSRLDKLYSSWEVNFFSNVLRVCCSLIRVFT